MHNKKKFNIVVSMEYYVFSDILFLEWNVLFCGALVHSVTFFSCSILFKKQCTYSILLPSDTGYESEDTTGPYPH